MQIFSYLFLMGLFPLSSIQTVLLANNLIKRGIERRLISRYTPEQVSEKLKTIDEVLGEAYKKIEQIKASMNEKANIVNEIFDHHIEKLENSVHKYQALVMKTKIAK